MGRLGQWSRGCSFLIASDVNKLTLPLSPARWFGCPGDHLWPSGHWTQTIRLIPPLTITREQVDEGLAIFRRAVLAEVA